MGDPYETREPRSPPARRHQRMPKNKQYKLFVSRVYSHPTSTPSTRHQNAIDATLVAELESYTGGKSIYYRASYGSSFVPVPFQASSSIAL